MFFKWQQLNLGKNVLCLLDVSYVSNRLKQNGLEFWPNVLGGTRARITTTDQ